MKAKVRVWILSHDYPLMALSKLSDKAKSVLWNYPSNEKIKLRLEIGFRPKPKRKKK